MVTQRPDFNLHDLELNMTSKRNILFLSHGGGPVPLLNEPLHKDLVDYWERAAHNMERPDAILVVSAHWETDTVRVTAGADSTLLYDYYGFPPETYDLHYPCPGEPELAKKIVTVLREHGVDADLEFDRGLDHGVFVPLLKMYPEADIPVVEMSLLNSLSATAHLDIGQILQKLDYDNLLIIGSGFSFHNMQLIRAPDKSSIEHKNKAFQEWLVETCSDATLTEHDRMARLSNWEQAPHARYCAPREEHLLPLHVCVGAAGKAADQSDIVKAIELSCCCFLWQQ